MTEEEKKQKARERAKVWYYANKEKAADANRRWRLAHPGCGTRSGTAWRKANPERAYEHGRAYRAANKDKVRGYQRDWANRRRVGARERLLAAQGGRCAICRSKDPSDRTWHRDHDRKTGLLRGVLCKKCNIGMGHFRESPKALRAAAIYLENGGVVKTGEKYF